MADADPCAQTSLGRYLATRLREVGCDHVFAVPGDFNLSLLDEFNDTTGIKMCWTCNELGAGYAADGFARRRGVAACIVTFCVGGLSALNACAGCYSEDLPVIFISGGPNSNDYSANHVLHHTIGSPNEYNQQLMAYKEFTCAQAVVQHVSEAHHQIDYCISQALIHQKPAYIEISCNLPTLKHLSFQAPPVPFALQDRHTNKASLEAAVKATVAAIKGAAKPLWLGGPRLRKKGRREAFFAAAEATLYPVAMMPDGKGMFPEDHAQYIGIYWGSISTSGVNPAVESADITISVGAVWTDYSTLGYSVLLKPSHVIDVQHNRVTVCGGHTFGCIDMEDFLIALSTALKPDPKPLEVFRRMEPRSAPAAPKPPPADDEPATAAADGVKKGPLLTTLAMERQLQSAIEGDMTLLAETGDAWFHCVKTQLPRGALFEIQMRYGSIGWSVGATLGYSLAAKAQGGRLLSVIGDGSFQMTAQEVSSMLRWGANPIILLVNNTTYIIEEMIHRGEGYNTLQVWDYVGFVKALHNGQGKLWTAVVKTEAELGAALRTAKEKVDCLCFIEAHTPSDDCSAELLEFGARVANANSRPPNPQ